MYCRIMMPLNLQSFITLSIINHNLFKFFSYLLYLRNSNRKIPYSSIYINQMRKIFTQKSSKVALMKNILTFLLFVQNAYSQQQPNLLVNGNFNMSDLKGNSYASLKSIPGWSCTKNCQIGNCLLMNQYWASKGSYNANCTGFFTDLISDTLQNLTQNIVLDYDYYMFSLNYYYPRAKANTKTLQIYFNEINIFNLTPTVPANYIGQYFEKRIQGLAGVNTLRLTTKRNSGLDFYGFMVNNIKLTKVKTTSSLKSFINNTIMSNSTEVIAKFPGSRILFADFMTFFVNFDRLQFYYYHNRNYSQYSTVLLQSINILNNLKGLFIQNILEHLVPALIHKISAFFASINYKYQYTPSVVVGRDESGGGFVSNCYTFFVYSIPGTISTFAVVFFFFHLMRKRPASRLIRKFSFFGILMLMVFEGNIESLTYYSIGEMTLFFSANFHHRFINVFIVFFQLIVTMFSVGSVLLFKYHYRRLIFYFIEDKRNNGLGVLCQTVDNGIICMLFGMVHRLLFPRPQLQLFILLFLECAWMLFKMCFIFNKIYVKKFSEFIMFIAGFVRISFIITFYFYEGAGDMRSLINDSAHKGLIVCTMLLWLQQTIVSFVQLIISVPKFFIKLRLIVQRRKACIQANKQKALSSDIVEKFEVNVLEDISKSQNQFAPKVSIRTPTMVIATKEKKLQAQELSIVQKRVQKIFKFNYKKKVSN